MAVTYRALLLCVLRAGTGLSKHGVALWGLSGTSSQSGVGGALTSSGSSSTVCTGGAHTHVGDFAACTRAMDADPPLLEDLWPWLCCVAEHMN